MPEIDPCLYGLNPQHARQLIELVEKGMAHPRVSQYKHGDFLNDCGKGNFSADFFGFALVGKFGDPQKAFEAYRQKDATLAQLLEIPLTEAEEENCIMVIGNQQDSLDYGTRTIVSRFRAALTSVTD